MEIKKNNVVIRLIIVFLIYFTFSAEAQLVKFSFTGASGNETNFEPDAQPDNGTMSPISRGSGISPSSNANTFSATAWTTSNEPDSADYFRFSIEANPGYRITLTKIELDERRSLSGIRKWTIRSSLDGFIANLAIFEVPDNDLTRTSQSVILNHSFDYIEGNIEFRIYGFASESAAGSWRVDNIKIYGHIEQEDISPPIITKVIGLNPHTLEITFSESVDTTTSSNPNNYTVNQIGNPLLVEKLEGNPNQVLLHFQNPFEYTDYDITVKEIRDLRGNQVDENVLFSFYFNLPEPVLSQLIIKSRTNIDLIFNTPMDSLSAVTLANYNVSDSFMVVNAQIDPLQTNTIHLVLSEPLTNNRYEIKINNLKSIYQVLFPDHTATFFNLTAINYRQIVINEIFADPTGANQPDNQGLPNSEFVELYNTGSKTINLKGFKLTGGRLPEFTLPAKSFVILCPIANISLFENFENVLGVSNWNTLNNSGEKLLLQDTLKNSIDSLFFGLSWYNDKDKEDGGWSLEQINPYVNCNGANNWGASVSNIGATPGAQNTIFNIGTEIPTIVIQVKVLADTLLTIEFNNSILAESLLANNYYCSTVVKSISLSKEQSSIVEFIFSSKLDSTQLYQLFIKGFTDCSGKITVTDTLSFGLGAEPFPGDIVINEIFADPSPVIGLPAFEFVELYNTTGKVLSLRSCTWSDASTSVSFKDEIILPNQYLILTTANAISQFSQFGKSIAISPWPSLNNNSDKLTLGSKKTGVLSTISYTLDWYADAEKKDGGWSLEQINPAAICKGSSANWQASMNISGGTPGQVNSVFNETPDSQPPTVKAINIMDTKNAIALTFSESIDTLIINKINFESELVIDHVKIVSDTQFEIHFKEFLIAGKLYQILLNGIKDCSGNALDDKTIVFAIGRNPEYHELIITEIFADPSPVVGLPEYEFIEIYNASSDVLALGDVWYADENSSLKLPSHSIMPGEYLILSSTSGSKAFATYGRSIALSNWPSLSNSGERLTLFTTDKLIFSLKYSDLWYNDLEKKQGGWSLEMVDLTYPCVREKNWTASIDSKGGTPGKTNTVKESRPDLTGPSLLQIEVINESELKLFFNENLHPKYWPGNILINQFDSPLSMLLDSPSHDIVYLKLADPLEKRVVYKLQSTGFKDCAGNKSAEQFIGFAMPEPALPEDVVINEILFNPYPGGIDFVEIYNRSEKYISLKNWQLANWKDEPVNLKKITNNNLILHPQQYLVITTNIENILTNYPKSIPDNFYQVAALPSLPDDEGNIALLDADELPIDRFEYSESMHSKIIKNKNGVSLEKINFNKPSSDLQNWHSGSSVAGYATPGSKNSQFLAHDIGNSAIEIIPKIFSPYGENNSVAFTQIQYDFENTGNIGNIKIFDISGRLVINLANNILLSTTGSFKWDGIDYRGNKVKTGHYLIYFEVFSLNGQKKLYKETVVVATLPH